MASQASSSLLNTRAGPECLYISGAQALRFTTPQSGARLPAHDLEAADGGVGILDGADDLAVGLGAGSYPLVHGPVAGEGVAFEQAGAAEHAHDGRDAAYGVQVLDV